MLSAMEGRAAVTIAALAEQLAQHGGFGSTRVLGVEGEVAADPDGDEVTRLRLTLSDPPPDRGTWPLEDVEEIQQEVDRLVGDADLPYVVTEFYPETREPEEEGEDEGLAEALDADSRR